jgi:hypothetical protein
MNLLKQIQSRRSKRRLKKSVKAVAASSDSVPLRAQPLLFEYHVLHEVSRSKEDSKNFRWIDKSRSEEGSSSDCGRAGQEEDTTSLECPRPAACSGWTSWTWMYSCLDWVYPTQQLGSIRNKVDNQKFLVDGKSDEATQASTPYEDDEDETGGSSQPSESRVNQILKVPAALVDDVSDITSVPSESDSDSDSSSSEEVDFNVRKVMGKKKVD